MAPRLTALKKTVQDIVDNVIVPEGGQFLVNGVKQFVTNGGQADSYVLSTQASVAGFSAPGRRCCSWKLRNGAKPMVRKRAFYRADSLRLTVQYKCIQCRMPTVHFCIQSGSEIIWSACLLKNDCDGDC